MSEEHDVECPMEDEKQTDESEEKVVENDEVGDKTVDENAEDCRTTVNTEEPSANTSKDDSAIDVIDKETLSSEVDEKKDVYGANERTSPSLTWTAEGNEFKISWNLPEGTATEFDYIALCCIGMFDIYLILFDPPINKIVLLSHLRPKFYRNKLP